MRLDIEFVTLIYVNLFQMLKVLKENWQLDVTIQMRVYWTILKNYIICFIFIDQCNKIMIGLTDMKVFLEWIKSSSFIEASVNINVKFFAKLLI